MEKKQSKWIWKTVVAACIAASILSYMCIPSVKNMMNKIVTMFATGDFGVVREFVASYGSYAAAVSFGLMVLQSVMAPLPAFLITFANANLFGWWQGAILSWSSAMAGAALCFYIARILGRDAAEKLTSKAGLKQIDTFFDRYGKNTILICRLLPFVSFDIVSYGAGLTSMPFLSFFMATGIGQLPATIVYSYVGGMLTGGARFFVTGLMILFALSAFVVMVRKIYRKTRKNKEEEMKKKFVTLGIMMALSMTVAAGCGQKAGNETTARETAESTAADTAAADTAPADSTVEDTTAADTTGADGAASETAAAAQSDGSYQYVSPKEAVAAAKDKSAHVLDVREWDNYVKGRMADSMWCPIFPLEDDSLAEAMGTYAKENLSDGQKIYIICNSGKRGAEKATGVLKEAGIDGSLIYTVEGGAKALESEKGALTTNRADEDIDWKTVAAADALKAVGGSDIQILDVRDNDTYAKGHLKGSIQSSLKEIEDPAAQTAMYKMAKEEMDPSKPVYLLCYSGNKCAKTGISVMKDAGFDVDNLFIIENGAKDKDIQAAFVTE